MDRLSHPAEDAARLDQEEWQEEVIHARIAREERQVSSDTTWLLSAVARLSKTTIEHRAGHHKGRMSCLTGIRTNRRCYNCCYRPRRLAKLSLPAGRRPFRRLKPLPARRHPTQGQRKTHPSWFSRTKTSRVSASCSNSHAIPRTCVVAWGSTGRRQQLLFGVDQSSTRNAST